MSNELNKPNGLTQITPLDEVINAHEFLKDFLAKFDHAKRGGIHDFMEIALFNMINSSMENIDKYLQTGHHQLSATEIMHITVDSYQKVLDRIKRNLSEMPQVNLT
jgi:hypothetical protein